MEHIVEGWVAHYYSGPRSAYPSGGSRMNQSCHVPAPTFPRWYMTYGSANGCIWLHDYLYGYGYGYGLRYGEKNSDSDSTRYRYRYRCDVTRCLTNRWIRTNLYFLKHFLLHMFEFENKFKYIKYEVKCLGAGIFIFKITLSRGK